MDDFWQGIDREILELQHAKSADEVIEVLNRYCPPSTGDAFFAGGGGDNQVCDALTDAGWDYTWSEAHYHWCMKAPDGSQVTYVEGDVYRGNTLAAPVITLEDSVVDPSLTVVGELGEGKTNMTYGEGVYVGTSRGIRSAPWPEL